MLAQYSTFEITKIKLLKCSFSHNPAFKSSGDNSTISLGLNIRNEGEFKDDGLAARIVQTFRTYASYEMPFSLELEFGAVFNMHQPVPPPERSTYLSQILPQTVFPFTREFIAEITRRAGYPPLLVNVGQFPEAGTSSDPQTDLSIKWIH
jgi:preprotein translocase subunit SecB